MNIKRAFLVLAAALLMPGLALAQEIGPATFTVDFDFVDGNDSDETIARIACTGGLPLNNQQVVRHDSVITFVLDFPDEGAGITECAITVDPVSGYSPEYLASGDSGLPTPDISSINCLYDNVDTNDENFCEIDMELDPVRVVVTKEWVVTRDGGDDTIDDHISIVASSDARIVDGKEECLGEKGKWCITLDFWGSDTKSFGVIPSHGGDVVYLEEQFVDSAVESENTCGNGDFGLSGAVTVHPGEGAVCKFTNTVFFEGIPTLNQYGLAIMALLMLGVGFVGFRRFV
jgi:hypothetical protein